jgi:hypothetical protein
VADQNQVFWCYAALKQLLDHLLAEISGAADVALARGPASSSAKKRVEKARN